MGRCYLKPETKNFPNKLIWHKLFYKNQQVGDILASFDLVSQRYINKAECCLDQSFDKKTDLIVFSNTRNIPKEILPKTKLYNLEILYWGLRNLKNVHKFSFAREGFLIFIEIGDQIFNSTFINAKHGSDNFKKSSFKYEIVSLNYQQNKKRLHS